MSTCKPEPYKVKYLAKCDSIRAQTTILMSVLDNSNYSSKKNIVQKSSLCQPPSGHPVT